MSDLEIPILRDTLTATAAIDAAHFVDVGGGAPAAGADAYGVAHFAAAAGEEATVTVMGIVPVQTTAAAVAAGDALMVAADGKVLKATTGKVVVGRALTAAPAAGGKIRALLIPNAMI